MKNKINFFLYFISFYLLTFYQVNAAELKFEAKNINTDDKNIIIASDEVVITDNFGNQIFGDKMIFNKKTNIYKIENNVIVKDNVNSILLEANEIIFNEIENYLSSVGSTKININEKYKIEGSDILFDRKNNHLSSLKDSVVKDDIGNKININKFDIFLNENYLFADNATIIDKEQNLYKLEKLYYEFDKKKIYGKDVDINIDNELLNDKQHVSRSKSRSLILEDGNLFLNKSVYTNCKKREKCLPWLIKAEEINHDKKNKIVNYKDVSLEFFDIPVFYFPKFFHPDPSVKRQSGFLTPSISAQNTNSFVKLPYFFAISDNSDFTLSPRLYDNSQNLYQGEYRLVTENSNHIIDASIKNKSPILIKNNSSDTHLFYKSSIKTNFDYFNYSKFDIKIQNVSDEKYLKSFNVNSPIIDSKSTLNSNIKFNGSNENLEFSVSTEVFENLGKTGENDRYEYILPNFDLKKKIDTKLDGLLELSSRGFSKLYETNISEKILVNDLSYKSFNRINELGLLSNYELIVKNFNADSKNSTKYKNKTENDLQGLIQFNLKLPLKKIGEKFNSFLTPIFVAKFNPNQNKNISNEDRILDYSNIYSLNRISSNEILEGGESITVGNEFRFIDKLNNEEVFSLNLASSFRKNENNDLPKSSSLGLKSSNITGESSLKINEYVDLNYNFLADNNLGNFNYHNLKTKLRINNFITTFEFIEENNEIGNESFLANETLYQISDNKDLVFRTRKNKKTNLTEYYDLIYQYKMDCLTAGIQYKKSYYSDGALRPEESIFFSITFMPFNNKVDLPGISK